ncbi:ribosomal-protein-alanine N-acetyltransferase [Paenibacillus uliginis N3/975]|uniref:Ribosomal-protein-alanine N-acetyltransferase n=1 Tax=Paenibacillus uliginis N3/975 TaxID=1313296 RepID=A0A1X7HQY9_9BACL|nr:GNAT family protein [Paenibacillus uliginis]SMF90730.1 ribosomal-protein-alanine N-acetyltransferase [Paenibacillus uliginis N3/975]
MYQCKGVIPELRGTTVRLRKMSPRDADDLYQCWSDEWTARYLYLPSMTGRHDAEALILLLNELSESEDSLRWGVEHLDSGIMIGSCGFNGWQLQGAFRGEFGCELASSYWGNGYMREAAAMALEYGFRVMGLNRVEAFSDIRNERGAEFFRKIGFEHEGILREYKHTSTGYIDVNVFSLLRRDWNRENISDQDIRG